MIDEAILITCWNAISSHSIELTSHKSTLVLSGLKTRIQVHLNIWTSGRGGTSWE
jgi:hypothetical protein